MRIQKSIWPIAYIKYIPACSTMKLLKTGFPQSLHLTSPISEVDVSGRAPKIFMSRAESHDVGGEGSVFSVLDGGEGASQENGDAGAGEGLSLRVMVVLCELCLAQGNSIQMGDQCHVRVT